MSLVLRERFLYYLIRFFLFPFQWMPYSWIRFVGKRAGTLGFYCLRRYRKRTLSNLALASSLELTQTQILKTAKQSFQNLAINCLEYGKLGQEKDLSAVIQCENPEIAGTLYAQGQGIIFFCAHQANWEVLFLDGTSRMKGVAIGKSIHNKRLYEWILSIRERNGGKIITPQNAVREGMRALKKGVFLGIVGDQGTPSSGHNFPFLGRKAWTSTAPALLAYRTQSPIIFAETKRTSKGYKIRYSEPIWPNCDKPMEEEVPRLMNAALSLLETSIGRTPGEWLWQHNRWKQQTPHKISKRFRHDCLCIILPSDPALFTEITPHLACFRKIYPTEFISLLVPESMRGVSLPNITAEILHYHGNQDALLPDFRFKLVFNFTNDPKIARHYLKLSAFEVLGLEDLQKLAAQNLCPGEEKNLSILIQRALYRSNVRINDAS